MNFEDSLKAITQSSWEIHHDREWVQKCDHFFIKLLLFMHYNYRMGVVESWEKKKGKFTFTTPSAVKCVNWISTILKKTSSKYQYSLTPHEVLKKASHHWKGYQIKCKYRILYAIYKTNTYHVHNKDWLKKTILQ